MLDEVQITTCGSLGVCERGPNLVVYPEGVWYSGVRPEDVPELVESHFVQGRPVERLVNRDAGGAAGGNPIESRQIHGGATGQGCVRRPAR